MYRRAWCQGYVKLWRALCRWKGVEQAPHSFEVLRVAGAFSPTLAMAQARASYMLRLVQFGPPALTYLLQTHWRLAPNASWLGQFAQDIKVVGAFVPTVSVLQGTTCQVAGLLDSLSHDRNWWPMQIRKAGAGFLDDLRIWHARYVSGSRAASGPSVGTDLPFRCAQCAAGFRLRNTRLFTRPGPMVISAVPGYMQAPITVLRATSTCIALTVFSTI